MDYIAGKKYQIRSVTTLTEVGNVARIRTSRMLYRIWNESEAINIKKAEYWKDEDDNWIKLKPAVYAPVSYVFVKLDKKFHRNVDQVGNEVEVVTLAKEELFVKSASSLNRSRQNIQDLVYLKFRPGDYFITLTFKENLTDIKETNKYFNLFNLQFNKYLRSKDAEYKWLLVHYKKLIWIRFQKCYFKKHFIVVRNDLLKH